MKGIRSLTDPLALRGSVVLTIGVYDGLHLGHQIILKKLQLFSATAVRKKRDKKNRISSQAIRPHLKKGDLNTVKKMLGRPYSLLLPFDHKDVTEERETLYTWTRKGTGLCPLPSFTYRVIVRIKGKKVAGVALYRNLHQIDCNPTFILTLIFKTPSPFATEIDVAFLSYLCNDLEKVSPHSLQTNQLLTPQLFSS